MFEVIDNDRVSEMDRNEEEKMFQRVVNAFKNYRSHSLASNEKRRKDWLSIPSHHRSLITSFEARLDQVEQRISKNADVIHKIVHELADNSESSQSKKSALLKSTEGDMDKVRSR